MSDDVVMAHLRARTRAEESLAEFERLERDLMALEFNARIAPIDHPRHEIERLRAKVDAAWKKHFEDSIAESLAEHDLECMRQRSGQ